MACGEACEEYTHQMGVLMEAVEEAISQVLDREIATGSEWCQHLQGCARCRDVILMGTQDYLERALGLWPQISDEELQQSRAMVLSMIYSGSTDKELPDSGDAVSDRSS